MDRASGLLVGVDHRRHHVGHEEGVAALGRDACQLLGHVAQ